MCPWNPNTKSTGRPGELNPGSSDRPSRSVCTVSQPTEPPRQVSLCCLICIIQPIKFGQYRFIFPDEFCFGFLISFEYQKMHFSFWPSTFSSHSTRFVLGNQKTTYLTQPLFACSLDPYASQIPIKVVVYMQAFYNCSQKFCKLTNVSQTTLVRLPLKFGLSVGQQQNYQMLV